jgi:hypothetical protein
MYDICAGTDINHGTSAMVNRALVSPSVATESAWAWPPRPIPAAGGHAFRRHGRPYSGVEWAVRDSRRRCTNTAACADGRVSSANRFHPVCEAGPHCRADGEHPPGSGQRPLAGHRLDAVGRGSMQVRVKMRPTINIRRPIAGQSRRFKLLLGELGRMAVVTIMEIVEHPAHFWGPPVG